MLFCFCFVLFYGFSSCIRPVEWQCKQRPGCGHLSKGSTDEERHISQSNIYIFCLSSDLKLVKKRKRLNEDSCVTSQLQMAVVYIDYRLYASSDQTISGT